MHTYEEELRRLMRKSPLIELIKHTFQKKKLKAKTLPSDRNGGGGGEEKFEKMV